MRKVSNDILLSERQLIEYLFTHKMSHCWPLSFSQLLLFLCGSKESYRRLRDLHALKSHMKTVRYEEDLTIREFARLESAKIRTASNKDPQRSPE